MPAKKTKNQYCIEEIRHNLARLYGPTGSSKNEPMRTCWALLQELPRSERDVIEALIMDLVNTYSDMGCGSAFMFVIKIAQKDVLLATPRRPGPRGLRG